MNFYLLQLVGKWISLITLSMMSLFNVSVEKTQYEVEDNNVKNVSVLTEIIEYETITTYNSSLPSNIQKTLVKGKNGVSFIDKNGETVVLEAAVNEEIELGTGKYGVYKGIMTGYGPDCSTCNGIGYVACKTESKENFNLIEDGVYYNDSEYGEVRVLAAALTEFPCGTIINVESKTLGNFVGIVLDTGYDMRKHLEEGIYHFDVAYTTEKDEMVAKTTDMSGNVIYNVQRWGW